MICIAATLHVQDLLEFEHRHGNQGKGANDLECDWDVASSDQFEEFLFVLWQQPELELTVQYVLFSGHKLQVSSGLCPLRLMPLQHHLQQVLP